MLSKCDNISLLTDTNNRANIIYADYLIAVDRHEEAILWLKKLAHWMPNLPITTIAYTRNLQKAKSEEEMRGAAEILYNPTLQSFNEFRNSIIERDFEEYLTSIRTYTSPPLYSSRKSVYIS